MIANSSRSGFLHQTLTLSKLEALESAEKVVSRLESVVPFFEALTARQKACA